MLKKISFTISLFVVLSFNALSQQRIIREEYLKITPYISTLEDVTEIYGKGDNIVKGREDYLAITYTIDKDKEVAIHYFRDCNQIDKPEKERTWIVEDMFFNFDEELKIKPKNIFLNERDFTGCPYGDVEGQIIYFNGEKNIQFTYMRNIQAVTDLHVMATEKNKEKYRCKNDDVTFTLDPNGFRCSSPD